MTRNATLNVIAAVAFLGCNGNASNDSDGGNDTTDDTSTFVDMSFPEEESCVGIDIGYRIVEDAYIGVNYLRSAILVGTGDVAYLVYQQDGDHLHRPVVVREIYPGGELGEHREIDFAGAFSGESILKISGGGYSDGRLILIGSQDSRYGGSTFSEGNTDNYFMEVDPVSMELVGEPKDILGRCYYQTPGCYGQYIHESGKIYEAVTIVSCSPPYEHCDYSSYLGLVDPLWVENGRELPYEWIVRVDEECSLNVHAGFHDGETMVSWVTTGTLCLDETSGFVKRWSGGIEDVLSSSYHDFELGFDLVRSVFVASGSRSYMLLGGRHAKLVSHDGVDITGSFEMGTDPEDNLFPVVGYGNNKYLAVMQGKQQDNDGLHHVQTTLVDENDFTVERAVIYCPQEREETIDDTVFADHIRPIAAHWLGSGFAIAFVLEERYYDSDHVETGVESNLYVSWLPVD